MKPIELDDLLTVEEAAKYLKVPKSWIYERTRTRAIPMRKIGHHIRIPRNEFLEWIEQEGQAIVGNATIKKKPFEGRAGHLGRQGKNDD